MLSVWYDGQDEANSLLLLVCACTHMPVLEQYCAGVFCAVVAQKREDGNGFVLTTHKANLQLKARLEVIT